MGDNCLYAPSTVRCYNSGWDGNDVQWDCKAELVNKVKFGTLDVNCEGHEYPDDPNILAGSCGLKYTLEPAFGEVKYNRPEQHHKYQDISKGLGDLVLVFLLFTIFIMFMNFLTEAGVDPVIVGYAAGRASSGYSSGGYRCSGYSSGGYGSRMSSGFGITSRR